MALKNAFGGLALDETIKSLIDKLRSNKEPLFVTNGEDPFVVESRPRPDPMISSAVTAVPASLTAGIIAPRNNNRSALSIFNATTAVVYILCSPVANQVVSSSFYTVLLNVGEYWEVPQGINGCYKGPISAVWLTASGSAMVTEYS